jgi:hypothetical protein
MARSFFDQMCSAPDPVAFIRGLVNSTPPTYETDWLDFKQQPSRDLKHHKWREMWVEALTGFANNQGGVVIWGIDARKDKTTNFDVACGEEPVDNPKGVKSRLVELQRQATDPPLANVEIEAYGHPTEPGKGFVICFVPEGPFKPYRAEDGRSSQYYIRAGDNFVVMSRSMLQSLFYPRSQPVFRARGRIFSELPARGASGERNVVCLSCSVELVNDGTATARDAFVQLRHNVGGDILLEPAQGCWTPYLTPSGQEFESARPLHPAKVTPLFEARWDLAVMTAWSSGFQAVPPCSHPCFDLEVFCENQERQVIKLEFDIDELPAKGQCLREATPVE